MTPSTDRLKELLAQRDPGFDEALRSTTGAATGFSQTLALNTLRKKARKAGLAPEEARLP